MLRKLKDWQKAQPRDRPRVKKPQDLLLLSSAMRIGVRIEFLLPLCASGGLATCTTVLLAFFVCTRGAAVHYETGADVSGSDQPSLQHSPSLPVCQTPRP